MVAPVSFFDFCFAVCAAAPCCLDESAFVAKDLFEFVVGFDGMWFCSSMVIRALA